MSVEALLTALGSADPAVRVPAEQAITQARDADLGGFLTTVLQEFADESKSSFVRSMAGSLVKNAVAPSLREVAARRTLEDRWKGLPAEVRQQVKQQVLATLGSANRDVRNMAANLVGSLSRVELPGGQWPELINILVSAVQSNSEQHQEAALTSIGYICEEGSEHEEMEEALGPFTQAMLNAIVQGMTVANENVQFCATQALCNAMELIAANMEDQQQRDYLVNSLCNTASTCTVERTRAVAMEALVKVAELYYTTLPVYIERLSELTSRAIAGDSEAVGLQAMRFWISICESEYEMKEEDNLSGCLNYAEKGMAFLVDICLRTMQKQEEFVSEEEDWNLSVAGGKLLQVLAETVGKPIHKPVMDFVYAYINSPNWRERDAALTAFGCILGIEDDAAKEDIQDTVAQAIPGVLKYLHDTDEHVVETSCWVASVICDEFPDVFLQNSAVLQQLMNSVGPMILDENSRKARIACVVIHNLALAFEGDDGEQTNELTPYYADLLSYLLRSIDASSSPEYRSEAQETLNAVIDAAANDCVPYLQSLAPQLLERMNGNVDQLAAAGGASMQVEQMLAMLCGAVSALARKLGIAYKTNVPETMTAILRMVALQPGYVNESALTAVGGLAYGCKDALAPYLAEVVPYILKCLENFGDPRAVDTVVGTIGDLTLGCGELMRPYVGDMMASMYRNATNPETNRSITIVLVECMGDIILNILGAQGTAPYLANLMQLTENLFLESGQIDIRGDPESEQYVMGLWEGLSTFYTSVVQAHKGEEIQGILPYLNHILRFAIFAASHASEFAETAVAALMVVGDIASVLRETSPAVRQQGKTALLTGEVQQLLAGMQKDPHMEAKDKKSIKWVMQQLKKLEAS